MRALGWKTAAEVTGRDRLEIEKNNRGLALADRMKQDPLAAKSIRLMSVNMDRLSLRQVQEENRRLFADPSIFEQVYLRTRSYVRNNRKGAESRILTATIG